MKKLLPLIFVLLLNVSARLNPIEAQSASLDGVWASDAYGFIFVVEAGTLSTLYEISSVHCVESIIPIPLSDLTPTLEGDQLVVRDAFTIYISAHRLPDLPELCQNAVPTDDPAANFEAFWNTFNEHYVNSPYAAG